MNLLCPQQLSDCKKPLSFFSRALSATEPYAIALYDFHGTASGIISSVQARLHLWSLLSPEHLAQQAWMPAARPLPTWIHILDPQQYKEQHYVGGETEAPRDTSQSSGKARTQIQVVYPGAHGGGLVTKSCPTLATPWTVAHQAPLSTGCSRPEYCMHGHFLLQGIFPTQGWNLGLLYCRQTLHQMSHQGCPWSPHS